MKKFLLLALVCAVMSGCQKVDEDEIKRGQGAAPEEAEARKQVQFVIGGISEEYGTRATISSVGCTDLWVYEGTQLLKHQVSTDSDFGLPTVSLTYGAHDLTFVASKSDGQTITDGVWSCSKVRETFGKVMQVTVSGGSSTSRQVQLSRRNSVVKFVMEDAVPNDVKTMRLSVGNHLSLDANLVGGSGLVYEVTSDISNRIGQTGFTPSVNVMAESATEEEDCDVMIEFMNNEGKVLYHYERTVKIKANRCTSLTGKYFGGDSNEVSVDENWEDDLEVAI